MKKKLIALLLIIFCVGCNNSPTVSDDEIIISINIDKIDEPVYRLDLSYYLDDDLMGGHAVTYADFSQLKDKVYNFTLIQEDFPAGHSLDNFSFQITISGEKNGVEEFFSTSELLATTNICSPFKVEYGNIYYFEIEGDFDQFKLSSLDK